VRAAKVSRSNAQIRARLNAGLTWATSRDGFFIASSWFDWSGGARNIGTEYGKLPKRRGPIVQTGYVPSSFATKAIFFLLAALVVVFAAMLVLTVLHP
jgi:hypothetical protein